MQNRPVHNTHVRALLLVASDGSSKLIDHIKAQDAAQHWQQDALRAARAIQGLLTMVSELPSLRNQLVIIESIIALADAVNEGCGDRWSLSISLMMEQAHQRLANDCDHSGDVTPRRGQRRQAAA
jgi:hypothetical protein